MVPHVITNHGISILLRGQQFNVSNQAKAYNAILNEIRCDGDPSYILELIESTKRKVEDALRLSSSLSYNGGAVYHNGKPLYGYAVQKLIDLIQNRGNIEPLVNFLTKLQANPDQEVIDHLYSFLEKGNMPLTASGDFVAYKSLRNNYYDIHSGNFDNSVGKYIQMPRRNVDSNRHQTCSYGFHVCSWDYLPHFAWADGRVVACQINPADVVAVPADYNDTKMRVSAYRVIDDVTAEYAAKRNILSEEPVWTEEYTVYSRSDELGDWQSDADDVFDDFEDAVDEATYQLDLFGIVEVKVENSEGVMVFFKKDAD